MPEPEEQLYHQAADAMIGAQGYKMTARTRRELAAGWWRKDGFRAAVKVAYRAGILAAQRAAFVAMEQDRQRWGPTKAASGVYDMCRQVVRRTLDEMARVDG